MPRYDRSSCDLLKIKSQLSEFANVTLDQLWTKSGKPDNIQICDINLQTDQFPNLRDLIFGLQSSQSFDGVQMVGSGARRQLSYLVKKWQTTFCTQVQALT